MGSGRKRTAGHHSRRLSLQPTIIATSVAFALGGVPRAFAEWGPQVEGFLRPGTERSYYGIEALLPVWQTGDSLLFGDVKGRLGEESTNEFNLGLGYRQLIANRAWALGGYAAFDRRRSPQGNKFNQVTVGGEARSDEWDFRLNYYYPTTDKQLVGLGAINFQGFGLVRNGTFEEAMKGADVEVGRLLPISNKVETRAYLAGYSFKGEDIAPRTEGWRVRLEVRPQHNLSFGLSAQDDKLFGSQASIEIRYIYGKAPKQAVRRISERMTDPWHRDIDVVVSPVIESANPAFAQQFPGTTVVHIDDTAAPGGDGSFERRYDSVGACVADKCSNASFNTVRLWQGASTVVNPYGSIALQPGQTLWGEGVDIFTNAVSGRYPVIGSAGLGSDAVTLASNSRVAGVRTQGRIVGNNVSGNITIRDNIIDADFNGISINNAGAGITSSTITLSNNRVTTTAGTGVYIRNYAYGGGAMQQTVVLTGNTINATGGDGVHLRNDASGAGSTTTQTVTLMSNTITGTNNGVYARNYGDNYGTATQNLNLSGNTISGTNSGLYARNYGRYGGNATQNVTLSGNTITASGAYGVGLRLNNYVYYYGTASQTVTLQNSTVNAPLGTGISMYSGYYYSGTATQTVTLQNSTVNAPTPVTNTGGTCASSPAVPGCP